jgi:DNA-binding PadR family transcriptional regulator
MVAAANQSPGAERVSAHGANQSSMWGLVQPAVLLVLSERPRHGYALLDELHERQYLPGKPDVGNLYRGLRKMEAAGYVASEWERQPGAGPRRRTYSITQAGRRALYQEALSLADRASHVERILSEYRRLNPGGPPSIEHAVDP